jgi:hypothetical protein
MADNPIESIVWHLTPDGWIIESGNAPRYPPPGVGWHSTPDGWVTESEQMPRDRVLSVTHTKYEQDGWMEGYRFWASQQIWESPDKRLVATLLERFGECPPHPSTGGWLG